MASFDSHTQRMWLWASIIVSGLSIYILLKEGLPSKISILQGLVFRILAGLITSLNPEIKERTWVYILMIFPHVLLHFPDQFFLDRVLTVNLRTLASEEHPFRLIWSSFRATNGQKGLDHFGLPF